MDESKITSIWTIIENNPLITAIIAVITVAVCLLIVLAVLKKKNLLIKPERLSIPGATLEIESVPVDRISFENKPEFEYCIPIRVNALLIKVLDKHNNGLSERTVEISIESADREDVLRGRLTATSDSRGVATFPGLSIIKGGSFRLTAVCEGKQCASDMFDIPDITSPVERITFTKQPYATMGRPAIINEIRVRVSNSLGDGLIGRKVRLSLYDQALDSELLNGTLEVNSDKNGVAQFMDLRIEKNGTYRIIAVCENKRCESAEFDITPPGTDMNFQNKKFGSDEYYESLSLHLYMKNTGDTIIVDGEEL